MPFPLFSFGTLRDSDVLEVTLGRAAAEVDRVPARLRGYRVAQLPDESYPLLVESGEDSAHGLLLLGLSEADFDRIAFFENAEYALERCRVELADGRELDAVFFSEGVTTSGLRTSWTLEDWQRTAKPKFMQNIRRYMQLYGSMSAEEADSEWIKWESQ